MNILCVSDQVDSLVYNQNVKNFFPNIDLILCAGDLPMDYIDFIVSTFNKPTFFVFGNHNLKEFGRYHNELGRNMSVVHSFSKPDAHSGHGATYAGFKNIRAKNIIITDVKTGKKRPLLITGASGCMRYNKGQNQYTDNEMFLRLLMLMPGLIWNKIKYGRAVDIFLTHAPPKGIGDRPDRCHRGFESFLWFMKKFSPDVMVHGHVHIYDNRTQRESQYLKTKVINVFGHYSINFQEYAEQTNNEQDLNVVENI